VSKYVAVEDPNQLAFRDAWGFLQARPMFSAMSFVARPDGTFASTSAALIEDERLVSARARALVDASGRIAGSKAVRLAPGDWIWVLSHCLLHLGFGHLSAAGPTDEPGRVAACVAVGLPLSRFWSRPTGLRNEHGVSQQVGMR
jgi:hypothetical protein